MKTSLSMTRVMIAAALLAMLSGVGCGKKEEPLPPPPPQNPNPVPGGGIVGVGNCPAPPGGVPFSTTNQPYYAQLYSYATGSKSNSMSVNFVFTDINARPEDSLRNIGAVANVTLPDLNVLTGGYAPQNTFCVSSSDPATGVPGFGTYDQRYAVVSIRMTGFAQMPTFNPYGGYPGSYPSYPGVAAPAQNFVPTPVEAELEASLEGGRLYGTLLITIGQGQYAETYEYEAGGMGSGYGGGYGGGSYDPYYGYYY